MLLFYLTPYLFSTVGTISIEKRLQRLENAPQSAIPQFIIEYEDGRKERFAGLDIIGHYEGVRRVYYDPHHQPSVDGAALYKALHGSDGIEVLPTL